MPISFRKSQEARAKRDKALKEAQESRKTLMALKQKSATQRKRPRNPNGITASNNPMTNKNLSKRKSKSEKEMEAFKNQMRYIDSMQYPEKYKIEAPIASETSNEKKVFNISRDNPNASKSSNYFNTIKADLGQTMITAILDEGIKAWEGSRVRLRLLEPIFIDGRLLDKGQYLYGTCDTFNAQRLLIHIQSVVINGEIFPLDLSIYDTDGLEGLYIPFSSFRAFSRELGAKNG